MTQDNTNSQSRFPRTDHHRRRRRGPVYSICLVMPEGYTVLRGAAPYVVDLYIAHPPHSRHDRREMNWPAANDSRAHGYLPEGWSLKAHWDRGIGNPLDRQAWLLGKPQVLQTGPPPPSARASNRHIPTSGLGVVKASRAPRER